jgi:hypothetical protein
MVLKDCEQLAKKLLDDVGAPLVPDAPSTLSRCMPVPHRPHHASTYSCKLILVETRNNGKTEIPMVINQYCS